MFVCSRDEGGGAKRPGQASSIIRLSPPHFPSGYLHPGICNCCLHSEQVFSMVTRIHFLSAYTGDAGCLLQFWVVLFFWRGQHSALFNALKQESTAPIFQNQAGEGHAIPTTHTHLPGCRAEFACTVPTVTSQGARPGPASPSLARDHCLPE